MIKRIVSFALHQPLFVVLMAVLFIVGGWAAFHSLPIEAFPDVSDIQVNVITLYPGRAPEVYRRFRERGRMAPEGLRYVASWVDLDYKRCFQVMETDDEALLRQWTANWDDLVDFEIVPVRTSAEAAAAIK